MTDAIGRLTSALSGRYQIERELGRGGMATVYLAHDVRHDRDVAIKVLHEDLGATLGPERFLAEIKTTAKLQHPHILPLLDSGEAGGRLFYVMPYVAGETLRTRLTRETQLPLEQAVRIGREVADALGYAHGQGIVHRDIKPENILLQGGHALVADFGIALAVQQAGGTRLTQTGLSLGTPQYMSPEQAMGEKTIGPAADVYALGAVTYEMLTGEPPFTGATVQAIVAKVLSSAPEPPTTMRKTIPAHVEAAVLKALAKLPADRFATAAQFGEALSNPSSATMSTGTSVPRRDAHLVLLLAAVAVTATALAAWGWFRKAPPAPVARYALAFAADRTPGGPFMALSRSGNLFIYSEAESYQGAGATAVPSQLWMKLRDGDTPQRIAGAEEAMGFAISPDERAISIVVPMKAGDFLGSLKHLPLAGGTASTLADSVLPVGLAWLDDGNIVFFRLTGTGIALWSVNAESGEPRRLWVADTTAVLGWPAALPGSRGVLLTRIPPSGTDPAVWVHDLRKGTSRLLIPGASVAFYSPSGHIIYGTRNGSVFAIGFDLRTLQVEGAAVPLLQGVESFGGMFPMMALSWDGTLIARLGGSGGFATEHEAVWLDRSGGATVVDSTWRFIPYGRSLNPGWSLSPDGSRLAIGVGGTNEDIWVKQLPAGPLTRLTFDTTSESRPRWTPDGRSISYVSGSGLSQRRADGTGADSVLLAPTQPVLEGAWSPDGKWLVARVEPNSADQDIVAFRADDLTRLPVAATAGVGEGSVAIAPKGSWVAYVSIDLQGAEVYVRPFPAASSGRWQVSVNGGRSPLWARNGRELFYLNANNEMVVVSVSGDSIPQFGTPRVLFPMTPDLVGSEPGTLYTPYDISPDGSRFLMARKVRGAAAEARHIVIQNVTQLLKRDRR